MGSEEIQFRKNIPPQNPEQMSEGQRTETMNRFIAKIYDRVCLTGDWIDDEAASSTTNLIENATLDHPTSLALVLKGLAKEIRDSIRPVKNTTPGTVAEKNDANRREFADVLENIWAILRRSDQGLQIEVVKVLNDNLHYFTDSQPQALHRGEQSYSMSEEIEKTKKGLSSLKASLEEIIDKGGWKELSV